MSMRCKVNNRLTPSEVHNTTLKEEDMQVMEDTKVVEDIEAGEGVEDHLSEVEDQSSTITVGSKVTTHETI